MAGELQKYSAYYDRKTASDMDYRQYMEKRAAVTDLNAAARENANRQIAANTVNSALLAGKIDRSMMRMQTGIQTAIKAQTYTLVASQVALGRTFQQGFDKINNTLDMGFSGISDQLGSLSAAFSIGMARLESSVNKMSKEICDRLDALHDILNNPLLTQSRELYRRALVNYNKGFYEEALEDIKAAVEKNKTDYISWFLMGKVCLFGASEFSNVIDLDQAIDALTNAAKYISPDIAENREAKLLASEIWFYLGLARLTKSNNLLFGKQDDSSKTFLSESQQAFERSYAYSNKMLESLYDTARCKVLSGEVKGALADIRVLILNDRNYAVKVMSDSDFEVIDTELKNLIHELKMEVFENAKYQHDKINEMLAEINSLNGKLPDRQFDFIVEHFPEDFVHEQPYFDILDKADDFKEILKFLSPFLNGLQASRREEAESAAKHRAEKEKDDQIKGEIRQFVAEYRNYSERLKGSLNEQIKILNNQHYMFSRSEPLVSLVEYGDLENIPNIHLWGEVLLKDKKLSDELEKAAWDAKAYLERKRTVRNTLITLAVIGAVVFLISRCIAG